MPGQEASAQEQALPEQAEQHAPSQPEVADVALHILLVGIMVMRTARRVFMMGMLLGVVIDSLLGTVRFQAQRWSYEGGPHQGSRAGPVGQAHAFIARPPALDLGLHQLEAGAKTGVGDHRVRHAPGDRLGSREMPWAGTFGGARAGTVRLRQLRKDQPTALVVDGDEAHRQRRERQGEGSQPVARGS